MWVLGVSNFFDVGIALVSAAQATLLGYLAIRSKRGNETSANIQATLDDQITSSLLASQNAIQAVTQEVFRARQDHTVLANRIDEVHIQVHELRGDIATLSERISQGTTSPTTIDNMKG